MRQIRRIVSGAYLPLAVSAVFAAVYCLVVFVNHYCFRTYALDLGLYTNALYDYAHFNWNDSSLFRETHANLLADHLDFYLILFSPFSYIFGSYTLLILQIVSVISGATGCYKYLQYKFGDTKLSLWGMVHFYLFFGVFSALSFDYHSSVVAAMQVPWLFYLAAKKRYSGMLLVMCVMMLAKETMPLWCFCLSLGFLIQLRHEKKARRYMTACAVISLTYFIAGVQLIMPLLSNSGKYENFKYAILGHDYPSALKFVLSHPLTTFRYLFVNHSGHALFDGVKTETYMFLLFSGMWVLFSKPSYLLMLLGPLLAKMLYNDPAIWSIDYHYSVEFAGVITIGAFTIIASSGKLWVRKYFPAILCLFSAAVTLRLMDNTVFLHDYNRLRIYQSGHYVRGHDIQAIHKALEQIPAGAAVSAQSPLVPHLAYRDKCYQLPIIKDAEYIVVSRSEPATYPLERKDLLKLLNDSMRSSRWQVITNDTNVTVLKRR